MRWKAPTLVRLFQYTYIQQFINTNFFTRTLCLKKCFCVEFYFKILTRRRSQPHTLAERAYQKNDSAWKTKNVLAGQKILKMRNWKFCSMKIVAKHKKSSHNLWKPIK